MNRTLMLSIVLLLVVFFLSGCGGQARPDGLPKLYPVSITVIQEEAPLEGAMVQLVAKDEDSVLLRWGPTGVTDASGVAVLRTDGKYDGAPLGTFKVVVSKNEREPHPNPEWVSLPYGDPNALRYDELERRRKTISYIEAQYSSIADTPLTVEITADTKTYSVDVGKRSRNEVKTNN